jgi:CelD/BcsL family acetyltransferase involved in cellulose biosynthesis
MMSIDQRQVHLDIEFAVEPDFDFLSEAYAKFYGTSDATAFQAPLWMHAIHRDLAPNLGARQYTITVRRRDDHGLMAVFPFVTQKGMAVTMVTPADFGVCDYNAVVATNETLDVLANDTQALDRLDALLKAGGLFMFRKARDDGFDVTRLFRNASASAAENFAYHSAVDDDFDQWRLRTLSRHMTKELGRKGRQLEAEFGRYYDRPATSEGDIRQALEFIRTTRRGRFEDDLLQRDVYFEFYAGYAIAAAETGEALLQVSYLNDVPVAALFGLQGDGEFHAVLIAANMEEYSKFSLGTQIIYRTIKTRFDQGKRLFDMGLGNSGYKSHFRVETTGLRNLTRANSLVGVGVSLVYHHARPLKNTLRKYVPNVR